MEQIRYPRIASFKSVESFLEHLHSLGLDLPVDRAIESAPASPLALPVTWRGNLIGNRFAIQPMEGWDGTPDGKPTRRPSGGGGGSAAAGPSSSGAARRRPSATRGAPTPTSC